MKSITIMMKPVSGLCNMSCRYCFYEDEMKNRSGGCLGIMEEAALEQTIKKAAECSALECTLAFQGGEPTLAGISFFEACAKLTEIHLPGVQIHYAIQTNGYHLNENWCALFKKYHYLVGISLDGIRSSHDAYRRDRSGGGTFEQVMKNIELLKRYGIEFNILTVVNAKTAPKIRRIYETYRKHGFSYQQYIACLDPVGVKNGKEEYSLTPSVYGTFMCELFDLWYADLKNGRQPYIRQFEGYVALLLGKDPGACEQRGICGCQNVIESDGSVYPCDFYVMDEYRIGNVREDSFHFMEMGKVKSAFIQDSNTICAECQSCPYQHLCRNGCRRFRTLGSDTEGRTLHCEAYGMFFGHCYERLVEIPRRISEVR